MKMVVYCFGCWSSGIVVGSIGCGYGVFDIV